MSDSTPFRARLNRMLAALQASAQKWWYLPLMAFFVFSTLFVAVLPSEVLVIKTVLLRPKRWPLSALLFAASSALAALVLALLVKAYGEAVLGKILGESFIASASWSEAQRTIDRYGPWGVFLFALSPFPMQPGIAVGALGNLSVEAIAGLVLLGRSIKFLAYSYLALRMPAIFNRYFQKK